MSPQTAAVPDVRVAAQVLRGSFDLARASFIPIHLAVFLIGDGNSARIN